METKKGSLREKIVRVAAEAAVFEGWSEACLRTAAKEVGISYKNILELFPRGGVDLAIYYHKMGDQTFLSEYQRVDVKTLSHYDKVRKALEVRLLIIENKEAFRRSMALFSTPLYQMDGINLIWSTCDKIWLAVKDKSMGTNWYTKRLSLSAIYFSAILYFLDDDSFENQETNEFIDRRLKDLNVFTNFITFFSRSNSSKKSGDI